MSDQELALIVLQQGKPQQVLAKFLNLVLNYQYGLSIVVAPDPTKASSLLSEHEGKVRCVCVIQEEEITEQTTLLALANGAMCHSSSSCRRRSSAYSAWPAPAWAASASAPGNRPSAREAPRYNAP